MDDSFWADPTVVLARDIWTNFGKYKGVAIRYALVTGFVQEALDEKTECGKVAMKDVLMEAGMDSGQAVQFQLQLYKLFEEHGCPEVDVLHLETRGEVEQHIRAGFVTKGGFDAKKEVYFAAASGYLSMLPRGWLRETAKTGKMPTAMVVALGIFVTLLNLVIFFGLHLLYSAFTHDGPTGSTVPTANDEVSVNPTPSAHHESPKHHAHAGKKHAG